MLKEIGVSVYFEEQGIDTNKLNSEMIVTFPGMAAQQESEAVSGNVRWSTHRRMQSGEYNGTYPAYGYEMESGKLVINKAEAEVVRRIFDMYLQDIGIQAIANILNRENIPRKNNYTKWHTHTVRYILSNERYMGDALLKKKYRTDPLSHKLLHNRGERPQYYEENSNPAIISRETYAKAQEMLKSKGTVGKSKKAYWICNGRATGVSQCKSRRVRQNMVYEAFNSMAEKLADHREYLLGMLITQIEQLQSRTSQNQTRIREIDKELADLGARNLVITKLHTSGILNAADYSAQTSEINNKITELRIERRKKLAEDEDDELLDGIRSLDEIISEHIPTLCPNCRQKLTRIYDKRRKNKVKWICSNAEPLTAFSTDLLGRVTDAVILHTDQSVSIILTNGQIIGKEIPNGNS